MQILSERSFQISTLEGKGIKGGINSTGSKTEEAESENA
jgi:hypothetical protein